MSRVDKDELRRTRLPWALWAHMASYAADETASAEGPRSPRRSRRKLRSSRAPFEREARGPWPGPREACCVALRNSQISQPAPEPSRASKTRSRPLAHHGLGDGDNPRCVWAERYSAKTEVRDRGVVQTRSKRCGVSWPYGYAGAHVDATRGRTGYVSRNQQDRQGFKRAHSTQ